MPNNIDPETGIKYPRTSIYPGCNGAKGQEYTYEVQYDGSKFLESFFVTISKENSKEILHRFYADTHNEVLSRAQGWINKQNEENKND